MKLRLLFLNHNYRYMATYNRAMQMAETLARRGHAVTLMTVSRQQRWAAAWSTVNGVRLAEMPNLGQDHSGEGYGPLDNLLRCAHALAHRFDIVHMFDHKPNASFGGFAGRLRGARAVADWADWWGGPGGINDVPKRRFPIVGRFEAWWEIKTKQWADGVVTISSVLERRALESGVPRDRVLCVPNGAEINLIRPLPIAEARRKLGVPLDRRMVGFFGMSQGDMPIIMEALRQLPGVWFMVMGPKNPRVLQEARSYGLADRLWQTDFIPEAELSSYMACPDLMCLPLSDNAANRGRFAGKLMYYMAAGRPTVVSPIGDMQTVTEQYRVGLTARDDAFAQAIGRLLADEPLRAELGRNARHAAETVFNWERLVDRLEPFYARMLGREAKDR
jgi:glycosyltransferase involved in cell wall biosynthesis